MVKINFKPKRDQRVSSFNKTVTLCALSAAFAACSTSLICIFLLRENGFFDGCSRLPNKSGRTDDIDLPSNPFARDKGVFGRSTTTHTHAKDGSVEEDVSNKQGIDFAIIGWPKTGTSFLLKVLGDHPEVVMPEEEFCNATEGPPRLEETRVESLRQLIKQNEQLQTSSQSNTPKKYGIKCPVMIRRMMSIEALMKVSDSTRLIVGVRHPIKWFESYYNYRVKENYDLGRSLTEIKPAETLNSANHWKGCSVAFARYDSFLKQLAKVPLSIDDALDLVKSSKTDYWVKQVTPNPYKVFLYTSEQLSDPNVTRQENFRGDLQDFLGLDVPFGNFADVPKINSNSEKYPEYIDICAPKYDKIRATLIKMGTKSSEWILEKFVKSKDVVISDEAFFEASLLTWRIDPCSEKSTGAMNKGAMNKGAMNTSPKVTGPKKTAPKLKGKKITAPKLKGPQNTYTKKKGVIVV